MPGQSVKVVYKLCVCQKGRVTIQTPTGRRGGGHVVVSSFLWGPLPVVELWHKHRNMDLACHAWLCS